MYELSLGSTGFSFFYYFYSLGYIECCQILIFKSERHILGNLFGNCADYLPVLQK